MAIVDGKEVDVEKELTQESRDDVYTRFRQEHGGPLPVEEEKEEKEAKEEKETPSEVPVETEQPLPEEEAGKEVKEEKKTKTVPYDALHEERVKRKAASEAQRAAEERARRLEAQIGIRLVVPPFPFTDNETFNVKSKDSVVYFKKPTEGVHIEDIKLVNEEWVITGTAGVALLPIRILLRT